MRPSHPRPVAGSLSFTSHQHASGQLRQTSSCKPICPARFPPCRHPSVPLHTNNIRVRWVQLLVRFCPCISHHSCAKSWLSHPHAVPGPVARTCPCPHKCGTYLQAFLYVRQRPFALQMRGVKIVCLPGHVFSPPYPSSLPNFMAPVTSWSSNMCPVVRTTRVQNKIPEDTLRAQNVSASPLSGNWPFELAAQKKKGTSQESIKPRQKKESRDANTLWQKESA